MQSLLGHGVYDYGEVARLIGASHQKVRAWFEGWPRGSRPALRSDTKHAGGLLTFLDLIEAAVALKLRDAGVSLHSIRGAHTSLADQFGTEYPFSHGKFAPMAGRFSSTRRKGPMHTI